MCHGQIAVGFLFGPGLFCLKKRFIFLVESNDRYSSP